MLISNKRARRCPYPSELRSLMNVTTAQESRRWLSAWACLAPGSTPLYGLPDLAASLKIDKLAVKDESARSPLRSFKALGAPIALARQILRLHPHLDCAGLLAGRHADLLSDYTVISATDGNHGRALAAAARSVGCRCVIVLHARVSVEREQPIAAFGAQIVRIAGNYDDSVQEAELLAQAHRWQVVSDTSYDGYEEIPRDVMQGYSTISAEVVEQTGAPPSEGEFTHVILQGGVGGLAAGVASYLWEHHGANRPRFVIVEPRQADCLFQSALEGRPAKATGSVDSVMAGLACGETSPLAWRFLGSCIDDFVTISDEEAVQAMRLLARGSRRDIPVVAGESGAAGFAGLRALRDNPDWSEQAGLDERSRVLTINTEGATAPSVYEHLVGESSRSVQERQAAWASR
jgi:diaminopropionate ammonia-lyase